MKATESYRTSASFGRMVHLFIVLAFSALIPTSFQLNQTQIQAESVIVQAGQTENISLTCLTSSTTDYANRLQLAQAMNLTWVKTKDFTNNYAVDEDPGYVSLKSSSFGNVLDLFNLLLSDQYYYMCGIFYSNGSFELFNSFNLFVTGN